MKHQPNAISMLNCIPVLFAKRWDGSQKCKSDLSIARKTLLRCSILFWHRYWAHVHCSFKFLPKAAITLTTSYICPPVRAARRLKATGSRCRRADCFLQLSSLRWALCGQDLKFQNFLQENTFLN